MISKQQIIDYIISSAVLIQSVLVILELYCVDVLHLNEEIATHYRVLLTAVPMVIALLLSLFRRPTLFLFTYLGVALVFLLSVFFFPETQEEVEHLGLRFTFPLVIGSALCLMSVHDLEIVNKTLYWMSYLTFACALAYFYKVYTTLGGFAITDYNMSFSYALLLPMASMYSQKKPIPLIIAGILFAIVVIMGSRGAAVFFILYLLADMMKNHKKLIVPVSIIAVIMLFTVPMIATFLENYGIESRTLTNIMESDKSDHDSGRLDMYMQMIQVLKENWFTGIGLFGDRIYLDVYCHNIILEVLLNFGVIFGTVFLLFFGRWIVLTYYRAESKERDTILLYFTATVCPLMVSHSYLTDYNFGVFLGILGLVAAHARKEQPVIALAS